MNNRLSVKTLCAVALLIAVGILIPMYSPVKIVIPPASYTLASHVAIFIAMMISPVAAVMVTLGTTLGFFLGGFPMVIVLRAASHLVFALLGSLYIAKAASVLDAPLGARVFSLVVGVIHGICEVLVVSWFYLGGHMAEGYYQSGFVQSVVLMVGLGTVVHSMIDFEIALAVRKALRKQKLFAQLMRA